MEWSKAMKAGWRRVAMKAAWNLQEEKRIAIASSRLAQYKNRKKSSGQNKTKSIEQLIAESAFAEDRRFKKMNIHCSSW